MIHTHVKVREAVTADANATDAQTTLQIVRVLMIAAVRASLKEFLIPVLITSNIGTSIDLMVVCVPDIPNYVVTAPSSFLPCSLPLSPSLPLLSLL